MIVIMTAAFYPQPEGVRFRLQCEQIQLALANGWSILVSSGPHEETNYVFRALGATVVVQDGRPHGAERRRLANMAINHFKASAGLWVEEKPYLLPHVSTAMEKMKRKGASALIFNRSPESWLSWPAIQQRSEPLCNDFYNSLFGVEGEQFDPMLGPVLFSRAGLEYYVTCDPTSYGVADVYPNLIAPLRMRSAGKKVTSLTVDIKYPESQRREEEADPAMTQKRMAQVVYVTTAWGAVFKLHGNLKP
jgi:hypothetical protein